MTKREKQNLINELVTNGCGCWSEADRELLNNFEPKRIRALVANMKANQANEVVINSLKGKMELHEETPLTPEALDSWVSDLTANSKKAPDEEEVTATSKKKKKEVVGPTTNAQQTPSNPFEGLTDQQVLALMPQSFQDLITNAKVVEQEAKTELVNKLTVNAAAADKKALTDYFMGKGIPELKMLVKALPQPTQQRAQQQPVTPTVNTGKGQTGSIRRLAFFGGQGLGNETNNIVNNNAPEFDPEDVLLPPKLTFGNSNN